LENIAKVLGIEISPEKPETKALLGQVPVRYKIIVANKFRPADKRVKNECQQFLQKSRGMHTFWPQSKGEILEELRTGSVDEKLGREKSAKTCNKNEQDAKYNAELLAK
jgi:hypothetical protein